MTLEFQECKEIVNSFAKMGGVKHAKEHLEKISELKNRLANSKTNLDNLRNLEDMLELPVMEYDELNSIKVSKLCVSLLFK